jgi:hypothetical protein
MGGAARASRDRLLNDPHLVKVRELVEHTSEPWLVIAPGSPGHRVSTGGHRACFSPRR